jgi:hypothetical protein
MQYSVTWQVVVSGRQTVTHRLTITVSNTGRQTTTRRGIFTVLKTGRQTHRCRSTNVVSGTISGTVIVSARYSTRTLGRVTVYGTISVTHWYAGTAHGTGITHGVRWHVEHAEAVPAVTTTAPTAARIATARTRIVAPSC